MFCTRCSRIHEPDAPVSGRMLDCLREYAEAGSAKAAAHRLGLAEHTFKHHLCQAYCLLGVNSVVGAYRALGWLVVPGA